MNRKLRNLLAIGLIALVVPCAAEAASSGPTFTHFGPQFGFGIDPDQFMVGGQFVIGDFHPRWTINPSVQIGFGDQTIGAVNFDGYYHFAVRNSSATPYAGGGFGLSFGDPGTDVGLNLVGGLGFPAGRQKMFTEIRIGVGDITAFKGVIGWNFPM